MDPQLKLVVVGHVDHGKSTLIGRFLHDAGALPEGRIDHLRGVAARQGVPFEFANVTDALQAERRQNVTIDTSQIWFHNATRSYVFIDAPGHAEFLRNMVTGAASADGAVLVVDAQEGLQDQTRRHGYLLGLLDVRQVLVLVNKMDLVGYSERVFRERARESRELLGGVGLSAAHVIPVVAPAGDNVAVRSDRMTWFDGPTFADALHDLSPAEGLADRPMRFSVQDVYRFDSRRVFAGRVESGTLAVGDPIRFFPGGRLTRVRTIERWHDRGDTARAGDSIAVTLADPVYIERGAVGVPAADSPLEATELQARVFWLGASPLRCHAGYTVKLGAQARACTIAVIDRPIDAASLQPVEPGDQLPAGCVADVTIRTAEPLVCDPYQHVPTLGRFVLAADGRIGGGGVVIGQSRSAEAAIAPVASMHPTRADSQVSADARRARHGHKGGIVWFTGLSGSGKSTLALRLERELFDAGLQAFVLDGDNVRFGLNRDLGFSPDDRTENIRRVAEVAKLFAEAGLIAIAAFISPYRSDRLRARMITAEGGLDIPFLEIYVNAPVDVCERRDPKGLYAKARLGQIPAFTGISAPYEAPNSPDLVVETANRSIDDSVAEIIAAVRRAVA